MSKNSLARRKQDKSSTEEGRSAGSSAPLRGFGARRTAVGGADNTST